MRLDLEEPRHGWLGLTLRVDDDAWRGTASFIVDSISGLVYAALELIEGRPTPSVVIYEESGAHRIAFADHRVTITWHRELTQAQHGTDGTEVFAAAVAPNVAARAIWAGLRRLEGAVGRERIEAGWKQPFPVRELAQLGDRLRG